MNDKFHIGHYAGKQALIVREWVTDCEDLLNKNTVNMVVLNQKIGWQGNEISFLAGLNIEELHIQARSPITGLETLGKIKGLKHLVLDNCQPEEKIDFSALKSLEECFLSWSENYQSIFEVKTLKHLFISSCPDKDLTKLAALDLEVLELSECELESLDGLQNQVNLKRLSLLSLKQLKSLSGLENLCELADVNLYDCKCVTEISPLEKLTKLTNLYLVNMGKIGSLSPLQNIKTLAKIDFSESTDIQDGKLSYLAELPLLKKSLFKRRTHYSHMRFIGLGLIRKIWKRC